MGIDPVQKRPREFALVAGDNSFVTTAVPSPAPKPTTRTRIARRNEVKMGGKHTGVASAGDRHSAFFENLPQ